MTVAGSPAPLAPPLAEVPLPAPDAAALLRRNAIEHGDRPALRFGPRVWTHAELLGEAQRFADLFGARLDPGRPPHVGVLLDNTPDYVFALCAAALSGSVIVGPELHASGRAPRPRHRAHRPAIGHHRAAARRAARRGARRRRPPGRGARLRPVRRCRRRRPAPSRRLTRPRPGEGRGDAGAPCRARRRRRPVGPAVHLGHGRRPQGGPLHAATAAHDRQPDGHDARAEARRRRVLVHAALPHELVDGRAGPGPRGGGLTVVGPPVQCVRLPP